jgi:hypothetical protein
MLPVLGIFSPQVLRIAPQEYGSRNEVALPPGCCRGMWPLGTAGCQAGLLDEIECIKDLLRRIFPNDVKPETKRSELHQWARVG